MMLFEKCHKKVQWIKENCGRLLCRIVLQISWSEYSLYGAVASKERYCKWRCTLRHILTFRTSFPESSEYDHPKGYSICKFLEINLAQAGFDVKPLDNYRDISWSVDCDINSKRVFFFVGYLGTKVTDWQLIVCSNIGPIGRMLGRRDENERLKLARAIHTIMTNDERFTDLKWFSRYTDSLKDVWCTEPDNNL